MEPVTRSETVTADDGGTFDAHVALPEGGTGPGILLLQEIFGVNSYLKAVGDRLAGLGYVVLAPDLFWRIERNIALPHDEASLATAFGYMQRFDLDQGLLDCDTALGHLRGLPETDGGRAGVLGFCLGGRMAYGVAARSEPDTAVSYYGSGIADAIDEAPNIACPILFHFGEKDAFIALDQVERIKDTLGSRPDVELHVHEGAGHAFDNHEAPMFHDAAAAERAWTTTVDFLARTLPA